MPSHGTCEAGLSPRSGPILIDDAPSCACRELPYLTSLPFLHSLLGHSSKSRIAHLLLSFLSFCYYVSACFPCRILSLLFKIAKTFDSISFLFMCWLEHKFPGTGLGIWRVASRMPRACCEGLLSMMDKVQFVQRLPRRITWVAGEVGKTVDLEVARRLSSVADWGEVVVEKAFFAMPTSVEEERAGKSDKVGEVEMGLFELDDLPFYDVLENASASMAEQGGLFAKFPQRIGEQGLDVDSLKESSREHEAIVEQSVLVVAIARARDTDEQDPPIFKHENDEAAEQQDTLRGAQEWAEDKDSEQQQFPEHLDVLASQHGIPRSQPIDIPDQQHRCEGSQRQAVKSLIPPLGSSEMLPRTSIPPPTYYNTTFSKRSIPDRHGSKTYAKSRASIASPVGTRPRIRRQSQTEQEAHRLAEITVRAASRAHHHWLRPCSVCAEKAAEMRHGESADEPVGAGDMEEALGTQEPRRAEGVYKRTVHWVKRQEAKVKALEVSVL